MMPTSTRHQRSSLWLSRRAFLGLGLGLAACSGCASQLMRGQTPEAEELVADDKEKREVELVGDYARPWGLHFTELESVGLVTNLDNTGRDLPPTAPQRQVLVNEMLSHEVQKPDKVLQSPTTSIVLVRGVLPPGIRKGDTFDVEVMLPGGSETSSLRSGWLMSSRLRQVAVIDGTLHTGHVDALVDGTVLVDAVFENQSTRATETQGRILGRAMSNVTRDLGLAIREQDASYRIVTLISRAINNRFYTFDQGVKTGVCTAKRPNFLELSIPANYRHNIYHYVRVVAKIPLREDGVKRAQRLELLEKKLLEPASAASAAVQLEAIGKDAIDALKRGIASSDPEVKFYSAEALAYLDDPAAAAPLGEVARSESAFRWHALTALTAMNHVSALSVLSELLHVDSAETRYGAFRAIHTRSPDDPSTRGETLGDAFYYHLLPTSGEPMVHFTRSKRPEMVLFGHDQRFTPPEAANAGKSILVTTINDETVKVSRFRAGEDTLSETCGTSLDQLIRTVVRLGGGYADVIQLIHELKKNGSLASRIAIEALPSPRREFQRDSEETVNGNPSEASAAAIEANRQTADPAPGIFSDPLKQQPAASPLSESPTDTYVDPAYREPQEKGFLDRINPWSKKEEATP
ncbi:MAG TPA: flagellar basal body P-ring protein FlgI [Pirellulaceae bacterium]|nr:flagellar basal body P-ring protein FlgI [Pirellulaceae bacterium]